MQVGYKNEWASLQLQIVAFACACNFEGRGEYLKEVKSAVIGDKGTWRDGWLVRWKNLCLHKPWLDAANLYV